MEYIQRFLRIKSKTAQIIPLQLNAPQRKLYDALAEQYRRGKPMRAIVLKARQMGFSTLTEAMIFKRTATARNIKSGIVAHIEQATANLFGMFKLYYDNLPEALKPKLRASNAREVVFDNGEGTGLNSQIKCMTAMGKGVGRSDTFQNLHISEYAFWPADKAKILAGLLQAVPHTPDTMIVIESTPNGYDHFKELWDAAVRGESDFAPVFCGWNELDEYRRPYDGFEFTPKETELMRTYALDPEQIAWRRWCIANNFNGDELLFRQEYPICAQEAFINSGECIFDLEAIERGLANARPPLTRGYFDYTYNGLKISNIEFRQDPHGFIEIYRQPDPNTPYVIGADTAGEGSDRFVAQVIDNITGLQVATFKRRFDEALFARQLYCLGMWYNKALVSVEVNFSSYPVKELDRLGYPKQFVRQGEDTFAGTMYHSYGFKTTSVTRPVIIATLQDVVRQSPELICDRDTLKEMSEFIRTPSGRAEAAKGSHDDCVMALAIAYYSRGQQSFVKLVADEPVTWTEDMRHDYEAADDEQKKKIIEMWGNPP